MYQSLLQGLEQHRAQAVASAIVRQVALLSGFLIHL